MPISIRGGFSFDFYFGLGTEEGGEVEVEVEMTQHGRKSHAIDHDVHARSPIYLRI